MRGATQLTGLIRSTRVTSTSLRNVRYATTSMRMPAMSPTMTEGGIASWKKKEGESFSAGDVLLEVETDKATIDVESQDDGVMGKIIVSDGSSKIPVGQIIAILAEEGDDLSAITIPSDLSPPGQGQGESSASASSSEASAPKEEPKKEEPQVESKKEQPSSSGTEQHEIGHGHKEIKHSQPIFPSVARLLQESPLTSEQIHKLKGTGRHGMLTKGDVLLALGKVKNAYGSAEKLNLDVMGPSGKRASEVSRDGAAPAKKEEPLDGPALRRLILAGLSKATEPAKPVIDHSSLPLSSDYEFDSIISPYASLLPPPKPQVNIPSADKLAEIESAGLSGKGAKKDEWAGLF
ncbi:pyruvate dehydrogenase X component [Kwoniella mangroviensis CBS 10435]|uniref:Pyruvate dehydrogenase X component n=1 Tax=Kwoniella mangroviensis CBS 10435 TaxID=1331196 RepID=A0A1B9IPW7_9TREE|nr:pyruvate dehydrogenase X component [Kwoniella mangroviensis CBS 10435]